MKTTAPSLPARGEIREMTANAPAALSGSMDVDEFMAFVETRPHGEDWELIEGVAVMKAPATYAHRRLAFNLCGDGLRSVLDPQLHGR